MASTDDSRNHRHWEKACEMLRREIAAMRAASPRTRSDNDDSGSDAADERIREAEKQLAAIEKMLAGREAG